MTRGTENVSISPVSLSYVACSGVVYNASPIFLSPVVMLHAWIAFVEQVWMSSGVQHLRHPGVMLVGENEV